MAGIGPSSSRNLPPTTAPRTPTCTPKPTPTPCGPPPPTPSTLRSVGRRFRHACAAPCKPCSSQWPSRGTYAYTALTTTPAAPSPIPCPSQVTFRHYEGSGAPDPHHPRSATFHLTVSVRDTQPVIIRQIRAALPGLHTRVIPALPLTVKGGTPKPLTVRISVHKRATLPPGFTLPHLALGLRNRQAQQQHSHHFGGARPRDLAACPHAACGTPKGTPGRPADRERISHGSNTRLPLSQQSNAEREPPPPKRPASASPAAHFHPQGPRSPQVP